MGDTYNKLSSDIPAEEIMQHGYIKRRPGHPADHIDEEFPRPNKEFPLNNEINKYSSHCFN